MKPAELERQIDEAQRVLRAAYYRDVQSVAECLKQDIADGQIRDREQLFDVLHEAIDGHRRVIITWQAMLGVVFSNQDADTAIDEFGADSIDFSSGIPWSQLMYPVFERDVLDALESLGVDVNDPIPQSEGGAE